MTTTKKRAELATLWYEVSLKRSHSTDGEWQRHPNSHSAAEGYADPGDILSQRSGEVYELGVDDVPDDCPISAGSIHNCPARVFAVRDDDGEWGCFGLEAVETWCDADTGEAIVIDGRINTDDALDGYERA